MRSSSGACTNCLWTLLLPSTSEFPLLFVIDFYMLMKDCPYWYFFHNYSLLYAGTISVMISFAKNPYFMKFLQVNLTDILDSFIRFFQIAYWVQIQRVESSFVVCMQQVSAYQPVTSLDKAYYFCFSEDSLSCFRRKKKWSFWWLLYAFCHQVHFL